MLGTGKTDDATLVSMLQMHHHHGINLFAKYCKSMGMCELLGVKSFLVQAGQMMLQEHSCPHAQVRYSVHASSL